MQVPSAPARLQASQAAAQAVLQHTPSTQFPEAHSLPAPQVAPGAFRAVQLPAPQKLPAAQSAATAQTVGQVAALPVQT